MRLKDEISALVASHATWLSGFLRGLSRSEADAEDSFQDVWARVIKAGGLPAAANARAYLAQTARAVVIDRHRRTWRMASVLDEENEEGVTRGEALVDEAPQPNEKLERKATHQEVRAAVRALPRDLRDVVMMRIEGELTFQEIADQLNLPLGTVLTRMRTATLTLKKKLGV